MTGANLLHDLHLDALSGRHLALSNLRLVCRLSLPMGGTFILPVRAGDSNGVASLRDESAVQLVARQLSAGDGPNLKALQRDEPVLIRDSARGGGRGALARADWRPC